MMSNPNQLRTLVVCVAIAAIGGVMVQSGSGQSCSSAQMKSMSVANSRPNPGFECTDVSPPVYYLKSTTGIIANYDVGCPDCGYGTPYVENGSDDGTLSTVDPLILGNGQADSSAFSRAYYDTYGAWQTNTYLAGDDYYLDLYYGFWASYTKDTTNGTWDYTTINGSGTISSSPIDLASGGTTDPDTCALTVNNFSTTWDCPNGPSWDYETTMATKDTPYTDEDLRGHVMGVIPPFPSDDPTNWSYGSGEAYYTIEGGHSGVDCGKMKYFVQVPDSIKDAVYTVEWEQDTTTGTNVSSAPMSDKITGTGDPVVPAAGPIHFVDVPGFPSTISETAPSVTDVKFPDSAGSGGSPGSGEPWK